MIRLLIVALILLSAVARSHAENVRYGQCHNNLTLNANVITQIQIWLRENGHNPGSVDGVIGEGTRLAIKDYRRKHNLGQSNKIDFSLLIAALGPDVSVAACSNKDRSQPLAFKSKFVKAPTGLRGPAKIVGPRVCAQCHKREAAKWKLSTHYSSFRDLTRKRRTKIIARKMGIKRVKSQGLCLFCHFTNQLKKQKLQPISGVSCESCHAPGKDWLKVHSEFSGKTKRTESKAHAKVRWAKSEHLGMIRPKALYYMAKNCMNCHLVPNEKLVNVGGHIAGSKFNLVSWSQGEVRHNTWYSRKNNPAPAKKKRMMYVVGLAVELETALRAVGRATEKNTYAVSMARRVSVTRKKLKKIVGALPQVKELVDLIEASGSVRLSLNNNAALSAAANKVASATLKFVNNYDGRSFRAIDRWLPNPRKYRGAPPPSSSSPPPPKVEIPFDTLSSGLY